jgi:hypothetical protein
MCRSKPTLPVHRLLVHLLVLIVPLAAGLAPAIALRTNQASTTESEESSETTRTSGETLAPGRSTEETDALAGPATSQERVLLSGRVQARSNPVSRARSSGHCWHNGLSAPLRV